MNEVLKELEEHLTDLQKHVIGLFVLYEDKNIILVYRYFNEGLIYGVLIGSLGGIIPQNFNINRGTLILFPDNQTLWDMRKNPYLLNELKEQVLNHKK